MIARQIVYLLLLSMMAPLNFGAAAWMSLSMSEQGEPHAMRGSMTADGNQASSSDDHWHADHSVRGDGLPDAQPQGSDHSHDTHSEADCESECLSCTNHCTTLALLSQPLDIESKNRALGSSLAYPLSGLAELLLRPPICV